MIKAQATELSHFKHQLPNVVVKKPLRHLLKFHVISPTDYSVASQKYNN